MMEKEIWRPIKGYEGWYEVSNLGNVRSVDRIVDYSDGRKRLWKGKNINTYQGKTGYLLCRLSKKGRSKTYRIHRFIAVAFIPNPENLPLINHKDENKANNCVDNLEWCDAKYNVNYGTGIQRASEKKLKPVLQLDKNTNEIIAKYPSLKEAERQNCFNRTNISACCKGKRETAGGFKWKFKE